MKKPGGRSSTEGSRSASKAVKTPRLYHPLEGMLNIGPNPIRCQVHVAAYMCNSAVMDGKKLRLPRYGGLYRKS